MKKIISKKYPRIVNNKKRLEKELGIKITNRRSEISISGEPKKEYVAEKVIRALDFGFPFEDALEIKLLGLSFQVINIKEYSNSKNLERVRARIIGTEGRTLKTLSQLTESYFQIKDNELGIICDEDMKRKVLEAVKMLIRGTKHSNVYAFLEKMDFRPTEDLGIKDSFKNKKKK